MCEIQKTVERKKIIEKRHFNHTDYETDIKTA